MDQHFTFNKSACDFCANDITTKDGVCPIPTCGLTVFLHAMIGGPGYPVSIMSECGRAQAGEFVVSIVKAAAHEVAERRLEASLAVRTAEEIAAGEIVQIGYGISEEAYEINVLRDHTVRTTATVAVEVARLLAELKIEHFFNQTIETLAK